MSSGHREYRKGENQDLFLGDGSRLRETPDLTIRQAEQIAAEMEQLNFRNIQIHRTENLSGEHTGFAVQFRDPNSGRFVLVGALANWQEQKRRLLESLGLALP